MKNDTTGVLVAVAIALPIITLPTGVLAEWSGDIEGGTVIQGDVKGSLLRFEMSNSERPLNQQIYADWIRSDSGDNSYKVGYEPQYWISDKTYVFGDANVLVGDAKARPQQSTSGTNQQTFNAVEDIDQIRNLFVGLGVQLINTNTQNFFAEIGAGQTTTKFSDASFDSTETNSTRARIGATQVLTDYFKLELDGDYSTSDVVDQTTAEAGLSLRMVGGALKYTYRIRNIEESGREAIDITDSFVSYSYNF